VAAINGSGRALQRGYSLLELGSVAGLLVILSGLLLGYALHYQEQAEKTAVDLTIRNIRSGLRFEVAERMIHGRGREIPELLAGNPVRWLQRPPAGYAGEIGSRETWNIAAGNWFFDVDARELGYVPRLSFRLERDASSDNALRWRVRGTPAAHGGGIEDVSLVSVTPYRWF
jgi:hypothetical protein